MTTDAATPFVSYLVGGIGPYDLPWPFDGGAIVARVLTSDGWQDLTEGVDWTVAPAEAIEAGVSAGAVTLSLAAVTAHAGQPITFARDTPLEQGWNAARTPQEVGLTATLDRIMRGLQDVKAGLSRALRMARPVPEGAELTENAALMWDGEKVVPGPDLSDLTGLGPLAAEAVAAAAALRGVAFRVPVILKTVAGVQSYDIGFDPGADRLDVVLNTASLTYGTHYTLSGQILTLTGPVVQGGDLLSVKGSTYSPAVLTGVAERRDALRLIITSDWQPKIADSRQADYLTNPWSQRAVFRVMLDEMAASWGASVHGIIHTGDVVHRANLSGDDAAFMNGVFGTSAVAGDVYPYGYQPLLADLQDFGRFPPERMFPLAGNHDVNARGLHEHKGAWTFNTFRETFGEWNYYIRFGNVGFLFLSDNSAGVGGQIPSSAIEWADRVFSDQPDVLWHLCIHQPMIGWGPTPGVVINDPVETAGGETTLTIGDYSYGSPQALQVYLGGVDGGTLLTPATYRIEEDGTTVTITDPGDYQYVVVETGDPDDEDPPMTQITLTVAATAGQIYQARVVTVDETQDTWTSERLEALLDAHEDRVFAVFYGHRGVLNNPALTNIQTDGRGIYHVNNNMSIPDRVISGLGADYPLIYSVAEWSRETNQLVFRRWNSTAGDWLENTHPTADHTMTITYPRPLDLGRSLPDVDSRKHRSRQATTDFFHITRDIAERDVFLPPASDPGGAPIWRDDLPGMLKIGEVELTDKSLRNVQPGDGVYVDVRLPSGRSNKFGGRVAWLDTPSRLAMRYGWETITGSDTTPRARFFIEARNFYDEWARVFEANGADFSTYARGLRGQVFGEKYEPGETTTGDVILLCRADVIDAERGSESHFRGWLTGRRPNSVTTTDDAMLHARIDHVIAADGSYKTTVQDMGQQSPPKFEWVYCTVDSERWLGLRATTADVGTPVHNAVFHFLGMRDRTDDDLAFTVALAADVSSVERIEDYAGNSGARLAFQNNPVITKDKLAGADLPGVWVQAVADSTKVSTPPGTGSAVETTLKTLTIPGGRMGPTGRMRIRVLTSQTNNANSKNFKVLINGTEVINTAAGVQGSSATSRDLVIMNRTASSQIAMGATAADDPGETTVAVSTHAIDTDADMTLEVKGTVTTAADELAIEFIAIDTLYSE